jgi:hypothetical protein
MALSASRALTVAATSNIHPEQRAGGSRNLGTFGKAELAGGLSHAGAASPDGGGGNGNAGGVRKGFAGSRRSLIPQIKSRSGAKPSRKVVSHEAASKAQPAARRVAGAGGGESRQQQANATHHHHHHGSTHLSRHRGAHIIAHATPKSPHRIPAFDDPQRHQHPSHHQQQAELAEPAEPAELTDFQRVKLERRRVAEFRAKVAAATAIQAWWKRERAARPVMYRFPLLLLTRVAPSLPPTHAGPLPR